jgi:hypothetical protein
MVTAILTVLYPLDCTVYDIRVCDGLRRFHNLAPRNFPDSLWEEYCAFKEAVEQETLLGSVRGCWHRNVKDRTTLFL